MKLRMIDLYLFPLADLHCGYGRQQGNILPSRADIPGRVVRAGLAGWALRQGLIPGKDDLDFKRIFYPGDHTPRQGRPATISFPFCTPQGRVPAPCSLFEEKGGAGHPLDRLVTEKPWGWIDTAKTLPDPLTGPVDFLRRSEWPAEVKADLKPVIGSIDLDYDKWVQPPFSTVLDLKAPHNPETGVVFRSDPNQPGAGLFAEEAMPATKIGKNGLESWYQGRLVFDDDDKYAGGSLKDLFARLRRPGFVPENLTVEDLETAAPANLVFLGHRRVPVVILAGDESRDEVVDTDRDSLPAEYLAARSGSFTITLTTDMLPQTKPVGPLRAETIAALLPGKAPVKKRVFCRTDWAHAFKVMGQAAQPRAVTLAAGSCGLFGPELEEQDLRTLWKGSLLGWGAQTRDGFGRYLINWGLHALTKE